MTTKGRRILIVDDDADFITATKAVLAGAGYEVAECNRATEALAKVRDFRPDLIAPARAIPRVIAVVIWSKWA